VKVKGEFMKNKELEMLLNTKVKDLLSKNDIIDLIAEESMDNEDDDPELNEEDLELLTSEEEDLENEDDVEENEDEDLENEGEEDLENEDDEDVTNEDEDLENEDDDLENEDDEDLTNEDDVEENEDDFEENKKGKKNACKKNALKKNAVKQEPKAKKKNFLNSLLNAKKICESKGTAENILLASDREKLGKELF
jgi:hypothetical protein